MAENNPAVSVIIPLYNAEKYVGECLDSLLAQTFQDFEVIVVDDCSSDNSCAVVNKFIDEMIRQGGYKIKLIKLSKNSGSPGAPRNFALGKAHGKYIYFLDADDLLTETALEELYNVAENFNADVVHVEKYIIFKGDSAEVQSFQTGEFVTEPTLETFDIGERVMAFTQKRYVWWGCNKLFRRQFLIDNRIKFPETSVFEDMAFAFMCLVTAKNYVRVPFVSYRYRIREDSLSHQGRSAIDSTLTAMSIVKILDDFMGGKKFFRANPRYRYVMLDFFLQERLEIIAKKFFIYGNSSPDEVFNFLRDKIFSSNPQDNVALTSYLFVTASIFRLYLNQQAEEIAALKNK